MPQSKPYNQHNKKQRKQKGKGNINERHFKFLKKKKKQNSLESKQKAKGYIRQGKTYKERALPPSINYAIEVIVFEQEKQPWETMNWELHKLLAETIFD